MPPTSNLIRAIELEGYGEFVATMRTLGATSAATACPHADLPPLSRESFKFLLDAGALREGAPGRFYLYESATSVPWGRELSSSQRRRRLALQVLFWVGMLALPIALIELLSR